MEQEIPSNLIEEVAGHEPQGIPMSEEQAYYIHEFIDPEVDRLITNLELEKTRRALSDEYQNRTVPSIRTKTI